MKYSIYVRNRIKRSLLKENPHMDKEKAAEEANCLFHEMLLEAAYKSALEKLSDDDKLKQMELSEVLHFSDLYPGVLECRNPQNRYANLYHGVRFDEDHERFEQILIDEEIRCGNLTKGYYRAGGDNCNEGEYISLINYSGERYDIEFQTFVEENVAFIISPLLDPVKCKYLPFEEWDKIKSKLPMTRQRYSYARNEFQHKERISFDYVIGVLYPFQYYAHKKGYTKTREDFNRVKNLLREHGYSYLPILDPTDDFEDLKKLYADPYDEFASFRSNMFLRRI